MTSAPDAGPGPLGPGEIRVGTDLVEIARLERLLAARPDLRGVLFTPREVARSAGKREAEHLAARFAGKEAVLKALGTGLGLGMTWVDVEILNNRRGRPYVRLSGAVAAIAEEQGVVGVDVSLTHSAGVAMASAVVTRQGPGSAEPDRPGGGEGAGASWSSS